jgi:hypothetical protein
MEQWKAIAVIPAANAEPMVSLLEKRIELVPTATCREMATKAQPQETTLWAATNTASQEPDST